MNNNNTANQSKKKEAIGAFWRNKSQNGSEYYSGYFNIDGERKDVILFQNTYKQPGEKTPDFRMFFSEKKDQGEPQEVAPSQKKTKPPTVEVEPLSEEEIPF